jgi:hypothetical protein
MKKLLFILVGLLLIGSLVQAQPVETFIYKKYSLDGSTYLSAPIVKFPYVAQIDTTSAIYIGPYTYVTLTVGATDTISMNITYQFSIDGGTWTEEVETDSLVIQTDISLGTKSILLAAVSLGHPFIRFIFDINANPMALGTTSAYYWARIKLVQ